MSSPRVTPWRTGRADRPVVAVPPQAMPLLRGGRPLKRWRWVGAFGADVMLCAATVRVGPAPVWWWAVWDRRSRTLAERTVRRPGVVRFEGSRVMVDDGPVRMDVLVHEQPGVETISPHGAGYAWTRKQGGARITGTVVLAEREHALDARGMVDDSAGYHARRTAWRWSAGIGETADGAPVAWNLVTGLHDAPGASERTVWVGDEAHEVGPVTFAADLSGLAFAEGGRLVFAPEAERRRRDRLLVVASEYRAPFGTFAGELPHAGAITGGRGVMEHHVARW